MNRYPAQKVGLDVIVLDHHVAEAGLPKAVAIVNPNRLDETSVCGQLAAVGVTFLFLVALNRGLRDAGYFSDEVPEEPNLMEWLDLVALGTVADVVPLTGVNRALVVQGIKVMSQRRTRVSRRCLMLPILMKCRRRITLGLSLGRVLMPGGGLVRPISGHSC